jgi:hypothetical protein
MNIRHPRAPASGGDSGFGIYAGHLHCADLTSSPRSRLGRYRPLGVRYSRFMYWVDAASWGLAGGAAAGLVNLAAAVKAAGFHWPWRNGEGDLGPRLFVAGVGLALGAIVAGAAHSQITGPWPALVMGVSAPSLIRGILSGVEVHELKQGSKVDDAH